MLMKILRLKKKYKLSILRIKIVNFVVDGKSADLKKDLSKRRH